MKLLIRVLDLLVIIVASAYAGWQFAEIRLQPVISQQVELIASQNQTIIKLETDLRQKAELATLYERLFVNSRAEYWELRDNPVIIEIIKETSVEKLVYTTWKKFDSIEQFPNVSITAFQPNVCLSLAVTEVHRVLLEQGYDNSIAISFQGKYNGTYVSDIYESHAGLLVETKEGWYFIDLYPWRLTRLF